MNGISKGKLALVGYFGWGNFGDELFIEVHRQHLGDRYDFIIANDLLEAPYFSRPVADIVQDVDGVLIGGGDLLNPLRVSQLYWRKEFLNKPVFVYGLGIPRQQFRRENVLRHYRLFFEHDNCKLVVARDVESYEWLKAEFGLEHKLEWYPDPVCSLAKPAPEVSDEKVLGVVMRAHRSLSDDFSSLRAMIDRAKQLDYHVHHIVLGTGRLGAADLAVARQIARPDEEVVYSDDLKVLCREISKCSLLATIKFHGLVVASMYGIPSIAMSSTPKNRNFLRMIERPEMLASYTDAGLEDRICRYPARIPHATRYSLYRRSVQGYARLKEVMGLSL